jgi:CBS domain-containing protein
MNHITPEAKETVDKLFDRVKIKDVMAKDVITVYEDDELSIAQQKFVENNIIYLVVINHEGKLVGLLSRKYLYKTLSPRKIVQEEMDYDPEIILEGDSFYEKESLDSYILYNIMSKHPFSLKPEDSLKIAIKAMADKKIGCIPIVDAKNHPCGVLSHQEIVYFISNLLKG